jgi:hypothetical protein
MPSRDFSMPIASKVSVVKAFVLTHELARPRG